MSDNSRSVEHFEPGGIKSSEVTRIFEDSPKSGLIEVTGRLGEKVSRRFHDFEDWIGQHKKASLSMAMACLAAGSLYVEATFNKAPNNNPFLAAPAAITPTKAPTIEMTPTKELVVKAPATPTEQPATAPLKKDSPTPAQKEPTPTTAPAKSTPVPLEIPSEKGKTITIPAKEIITPENFFKYFEPVYDENKLGAILDKQGGFLFPDLEKPIVKLSKDWLTFSGSVTLRAPFEVKKILNEAEYQQLMSDYMNNRISAEKPINFIAFIVPGEGALAPVTQMHFIIGTYTDRGRLQFSLTAPTSAEKAITYKKVGDGVKKLDQLFTLGEYEGGQGVNSFFQANNIGLGGDFKAREQFGGNGVTFIDDPAYPGFYAQENGKIVVPMSPSVK